MTKTALLLTSALVLVTGEASAFNGNTPGDGAGTSNANGVTVLRVGKAKLLVDLGKSNNNPTGLGNLSKNKKALFVPWAGWFVGNKVFSCVHFNCLFSNATMAMPIIGDGKDHRVISIPLNQGTGDSDLVGVTLNSDNGGLPGAEIAGGSVVPSTSLDCCAMETVRISPTALLQGVQYWIVASGTTSQNENSAWDVQDSDEVIADNFNKMAISTHHGACHLGSCVTTQSSGWVLFNPADHGEPAQWTPAAGLK